MQKQIEEMAKISNGSLLEVKPIKLRQKITKNVFELLEQTRKETAREILQKVADCRVGGQWFADLCQEYGVEVNYD